DLEDLDSVAAEEMTRVGVAAQRHHRRMFEEEQHVVCQAAVDAGLGEGALPLKRLGVRDDARLRDLQHTPGHDPSPMTPPSSPAVAPAIAQRLAAVPIRARTTPPSESSAASAIASDMVGCA